MPELPEVETTRRGITPWIKGHSVTAMDVRQRKLRWKVPSTIENQLIGQELLDIRRRAKYLLFDTANGSAILHLGMSGSLRIVEADDPIGKHDHIDIAFANNKLLRFRDPRRFGALLWSKKPLQHKLLKSLGPEPFDPAFNGQYLHEISRRRSVNIKSHIMNAQIVVGVGNIYASEALFAAGIHPQRPANRVSIERLQILTDCIRQVLSRAIDAGGTTLRDFVGGDGSEGYFAQQLAVYGRADEPCIQCGRPISHVVLGQRASYYCKSCQR